MRRPSRGTLRLLAMAAAQRACAADWEAIARLVKRRPETCRRWRIRYAEDWQRFYREAEDRLLKIIAEEVTLALAKFGRSEETSRRPTRVGGQDGAGIAGARRVGAKDRA